jgi:hypothetical protein
MELLMLWNFYCFLGVFAGYAIEVILSIKKLSQDKHFLITS